MATVRLIGFSDMAFGSTRWACGGQVKAFIFGGLSLDEWGHEA